MSTQPYDDSDIVISGGTLKSTIEAMLDVGTARAAHANARYWQRQIRAAWQRRHASVSQRNYLRHCIKCYRQWCELV